MRESPDGPRLTGPRPSRTQHNHALRITTHVGVTRRQPNPHAGSNRYHRRDTACTTAAANAGGAEAHSRTRVEGTNSTSIAAGPRSARSEVSPATTTAANPFEAARRSRRQRYI